MGKVVTGIKEVDKLFDQCLVMTQKHITTAAKKGAKVSWNYAKSKVPVSDDGKGMRPPGNLKDSLRMWKEKRKRGKAVYRIGPNYDGWYAHFQDSGFTTVNGRWIPGYRFLRDAVDKNRNIINDVIKNELKLQLNKIK